MSSRDPTRWYDAVAPLYDAAVVGFYNHARRSTREQLRLEPGQTLLDVACGTGENFRHIVPHIGSSGILIGTDYSEGMLARARRKVRRNGWGNVHLLYADAATLSPAKLRAHVGREVAVDRIVCTLGLSVVQDWETVFDRTWELLRPGGRYALMDWYSAKRTGLTRLVDLVAASEIERRWWQPLEQRSLDFEREALLRGRILIVSGTKPAAAE